MEDTGRFTLVISLNAHTDSIACATKRTNMSALLLSCHIVGRRYSLYFCTDYRRVMLRDSSLCPFSKSISNHGIVFVFVFFQSQGISRHWNNQSEPVGHICSITIYAQVSFWPNFATYCLINHRMCCNFKLNEI